jgi:hypothetical protein
MSNFQNIKELQYIKYEAGKLEMEFAFLDKMT